MRALHVIAPGGVGGAESVVVGGAAALARAGVEAFVCAIREARAPERADALVERAAARGVPTLEVRSRGRIDPLLVRDLRRAIAGSQADVVHAHGYKAVVYAAAACGGRPLFVTHHGVGGVDAKSAAYVAVAVAAYRRATRVFAVSESTRAHLLRRGVPPRRVVTLHNFVGLELPAVVPDPDEDGTIRAAFLGRLSPEKGADVLLKALAWTSHRALRLSVFGDGPERERLELLAAELSLDDRVRFEGFRDDVVARILASHVVVLPSRSEGLPMTMLEAMALGRPVLATRVGGVPEVFDASLGGELVPPDDPAALAAALDSFAGGAGARVALAMAGVERVRARVAPEPWAEATAREYARGLARPRLR